MSNASKKQSIVKGTKEGALYLDVIELLAQQDVKDLILKLENSTIRKKILAAKMQADGKNMQNLNKRITRSGNLLVAELFEIVDSDFTKSGKMELVVDCKVFNNGIFAGSPKQKHYDAANSWLDEQVCLYSDNTKHLK